MNYAREAFKIDHEKSGHLTFDLQVNKLIVLTGNRKAILREIITMFIVEEPPRTRCRMQDEREK